MNRTPRPVPGSRKAAVARAYSIANEQAAARRHAVMISAMAQVASATKPVRKGPARDARGRFVKKSA